MAQQTDRGWDIPKLGFGFMRLPKRGLSEDIDQVCQMVDEFLDAGLRYFDTAPLYDLGRSEKALKAALVDRYPRESFILATKCNASIMCLNEKAAKKQLDASLERTGAGYFDFYLLHAIMAGNYRTYDKYGMWDYVAQQKAAGRIKHWGFSYHSGPELLDQLLTEHPGTEFVQLQINYKDWDDVGVASRANYEVARAHGVPVIVMEPVKGGKLAKLPADAEALLRQADPQASTASWAIRFAASLPDVITVLSGMSNLDQLRDNVAYMRDFKPLDMRERAVLQQVRGIIGASKEIPCTACRYCVEGCPRHIVIPDIFAAMNRSIEGGDRAAARAEYDEAIVRGGRASDCIACGQCEDACPQHIPIISCLKECADVFESSGAERS